MWTAAQEIDCMLRRPAREGRIGWCEEETVPNRKELAGRTFERLTVVNFSHVDGKGRARWVCKCSCGSEVIVPSSSLIGGTTRSCGCLVKDVVGSRSTTHGKTKSPEYSAWQSMLRRCNNERDAAYPRYGGRGIKVSEEWRSFEEFLKDMGERPSADHSLERIDNNLGYCKANCEWATRRKQSRNRRNNRVIDTPAGKMLLCEASEFSGITTYTLSDRIERGWDAKDLFNPVRQMKS